MLRFANRPDAVFVLLIEEALDEMLDYLDTNKDDPDELLDTMESAMPRSARLLGPLPIVEQLQALKTALADANLYQLTDYHWLLLYETLKHHCELINDEPEVSALHEKYGIEAVDFHSLVDYFFWDTDYLDDNIAHLTMEQRQGLGVSPETFGLSAGMKPHQEELELKVCNERLQRDFAGPPAELYVLGSKEYPSDADWPA